MSGHVHGCEQQSNIKFDIAQEASTHDVASSSDYLLHRIMHGVPEGNVDIQPLHSFPMDSNLDIMCGRELKIIYSVRIH